MTEAVPVHVIAGDKQIDRAVANSWLKMATTIATILVPLLLAGGGTVLYGSFNNIATKLDSLDHRVSNIEGDSKASMIIATNLAVQIRDVDGQLNKRVDNISSWTNTRFDAQAQINQRMTDAMDYLRRIVYPLAKDSPPLKPGIR
jgi:hypothetical protein